MAIIQCLTEKCLVFDDRGHCLSWSFTIIRVADGGKPPWGWKCWAPRQRCWEETEGPAGVSGKELTSRHCGGAFDHLNKTVRNLDPRKSRKVQTKTLIEGHIVYYENHNCHEDPDNCVNHQNWENQINKIQGFTISLVWDLQDFHEQCKIFCWIDLYNSTNKTSQN